MKKVITEEMLLMTMLGMEMREISFAARRLGGYFLSERWRSGFLYLFMKKAQKAARICPATVAAAAPAMPHLREAEPAEDEYGVEDYVEDRAYELRYHAPGCAARGTGAARSKVISRKRPKEHMSTMRR